MPLTEEEAKSIKEHLLKQLSNFPEDKRNQIQEQVEAMSTDQVENFIQKNQLSHLGDQCIFCSIVAKKSPAVIVGENKESIAILEINPLSKGHSLIVPKNHSGSISPPDKELAEEISKKIKKRFNPQEIKINELKIMEHALLEVVPIYGNETEKEPATAQELEEIREALNSPSKEIEILPENEEPEIEPSPTILPKIPPRIP